jgi:transmembrane sensor
MSKQDEQAQDRQRAWKALGDVEHLPQIQRWLQEADSRYASAGKVSWRSLLANARVRYSQRQVRVALAACATVAILASVALHLFLAPQRYETGIGEQRDVLLSDGSRLTLNTATALSVRYSIKHREIHLERGEALFTVKHDATRPFDVTSGGIVTRALGTEFNVDVRSSRIVVSVLEVVVRVAEVEDSSTAAGRAGASADGKAALSVNALARGQAVEFSPGRHSFQQVEADMRRIAAWRTRRLEFSDTPFTQAIEEFNRYSATRMTIGTPELSTVRVSGMFRIGDIDGFLFSLREAMHIEAHASDDEIILVQRPQDIR